MFFSNKRTDKTVSQAKEEFKLLWNDELLKDVEHRDFSKAYNYALRKRNIKDWAMKYYFDFESEDSLRFKEACDAFDEGDILWTFLLIREFASIPGYSAEMKQLTNKRRAFLSDKRKESIVTRHSTRSYMHDLMQNAKVGEEFIKSAISDIELYESLKAEGKYRSAYKIAALTDKTGEYTANIKKYLYYAAKRPITKDNIKQTLDYFKYVEKYYNFKRKLYGGGNIIIKDIDVLTATIVLLHNGADIDREELAAELHRTVKVYCCESVFAPVCTLANYLYQIEEYEMERETLHLLMKHGEAIDEKYKKRYTCLELMSENSQTFIFRHNPRIPLECVLFDPTHQNALDTITSCSKKLEKNTWCIVINRTVHTFELNYKYYYEDRLLSTLEEIFDEEFGDYILEYAMHTYFSGDEHHRSRHSMLIVTSGKNKFVDFPKLGIMIKLEPITKKLINIHYCLLYLPEASYTDDQLKADAEYIETAVSGKLGTRFDTFSTTIEELVWKTVKKLLEK